MESMWEKGEQHTPFVRKSEELFYARKYDLFFAGLLCACLLVL